MKKEGNLQNFSLFFVYSEKKYYLCKVFLHGETNY